MKESFSYDEYSQQEFELFCLMARKSGCSPVSLPVYSEDIAAAFQIRHRFLKDCIEGQYGSLRSAYGKKVFRIKEKRGGGTRAMNGYILPLQAVLQLFYQIELTQIYPRLCVPELLHHCFSPDNFISHLN